MVPALGSPDRVTQFEKIMLKNTAAFAIRSVGKAENEHCEVSSLSVYRPLRCRWGECSARGTSSRSFRSTAGCSMLVQNVCTFVLNLQRAKIPKYMQSTKIHSRLKTLKYRLYRRRFWRERRHFSAFFALFQKNQCRTTENPRKREKTSHQNLENLEKCWKFWRILAF